MLTIICIGIIVLAIPIMAGADEEEPNKARVFSGQHGKCYAKSIPDEILGTKGKTRIYSFGEFEDKLLCEYDWYAPKLYLGGCDDRTLIRIVPWQRGLEPQKGHLAIGIYRDGKCLHEYTTAQLVGLGSGVRCTVSHYIVFSKRHGFRWLGDGHGYVYVVEGVTGKIFAFDLASGTIIEVPMRLDRTFKNFPY
jgi:hypothetical protein